MLLIYVLLAYLLIGLIFSVPFLSKWIKAVDEATYETRWTFKLTILPGCIVFWPLLLKRYLEKAEKI